MADLTFSDSYRGYDLNYRLTSKEYVCDIFLNGIPLHTAFGRSEEECIRNTLRYIDSSVRNGMKEKLEEVNREEQAQSIQEWLTTR